MKKIYDLEKELKKIIEEKTESFKFNTFEGTLASPYVFIGPIPNEIPEEIIPAIGIVGASGRNTLESKEINMDVSIGLFSEETEETYKNIYELIELISTEIINIGIYLNEFEILPNMEWQIELIGTFLVANISFKFIRTKTYRKDVDDWINGRE